MSDPYAPPPVPPNQPGNQPPGWPTPGYPTQGYPTQPTPSSAPSSALRFTVQGTALTTNTVPPVLTIDGYPARTTLGSTMIPIQPGPHRLEAYSQWMRKYGEAALDVVVAPNSTLEVFYVAPVTQFSKGSMGLTKQKRKGTVVLFSILGFLLLVIIFAVLVGNLS